jgi:hypothetical protein
MNWKLIRKRYTYRLKSYYPPLLPHKILAAKFGLCRSPDFLILGAAKAGTTSLHKYLADHPSVKTSARKEIDFFTFHYSKGLTWYLAHFPTNIHGKIITGESSSYYLFHPRVPDRVAATLPNAKFLVLLRNPIDRAYSHYQHEFKLGYETKSFEEAIDRERALIEDERWRSCGSGYAFSHDHFSYISRGLYIDQLKRWMQAIPRERFLILKSEQLYSNPKSVFQSVLDFLRLPSGGPAFFPVYNQGDYGEGLNRDTRALLYSIFRPYNEALSSFLNLNLDEWM